MRSLLILALLGVASAKYYGDKCYNDDLYAYCPEPAEEQCISYKCLEGEPGKVEVDLTQCYTKGYNILRQFNFEVYVDGNPQSINLDDSYATKCPYYTQSGSYLNQQMGPGHIITSFVTSCGATIKVFAVDSSFVNKDGDLGWSPDCADVNALHKPVDVCRTCAYEYTVDCSTEVGKPCPSTGSGGCVAGAAYDGNCTCKDIASLAGTVCEQTYDQCLDSAVCDGTSLECGEPQVRVGESCADSSYEDPGVCVEGFACAADGTCSDPVYKTADVVCRAADNTGCDVEEKCTGDSPDCPGDSKAAVGEDCELEGEDYIVVGPCGGATTCSADGTCTVDYEPTTKECRAATDCQQAAFCTGVDTSCPPSENKEAGTDCAGKSYEWSPCEDKRVCNAYGGCESKPKDNTAVCRTGGICDPEETCDGLSLECPPDELAEEGEMCTPEYYTAPGKCAVGYFCDNAGSCDLKLKEEGTECREAVDACDAAEVCDGKNEACPGDKDQPDETICGEIDVASMGECAEMRICVDGECTISPKAAGIACGAAPADLELCRVQAVCDGTSLECPEPEFAPDRTICGERLNTTAESCVWRKQRCFDGVCGPQFKPKHVACRGTEGSECDPVEYCTGDSAECPEDVVLADGSTCAAPNSYVQEDCLSGFQCQNKLCEAVYYSENEKFVCRDSKGPCDKADYCVGGPDCGEDRKVLDDTPCSDPYAALGKCQDPSLCSSGTCVPKYKSDDVVCYASTCACEEDQKCPGDGPDCPDLTCAAAPSY